MNAYLIRIGLETQPTLQSSGAICLWTFEWRLV